MRNKINLDSTQQALVQHLIPEGEYNSLYTVDKNVSVVEETNGNKTYWLTDIVLHSKDPEERESSQQEPLHFQTEFRTETGPDGQEYLVVNPQLMCGAASQLCSQLSPKVAQWRDNLHGNLAVRVFAENFIQRDASRFSIITGAEWLALKSQPQEASNLGLTIGITGAIFGLGVAAFAYGQLVESSSKPKDPPDSPGPNAGMKPLPPLGPDAEGPQSPEENRFQAMNREAAMIAAAVGIVGVTASKPGLWTEIGGFLAKTGTRFAEAGLAMGAVVFSLIPENVLIESIECRSGGCSSPEMI